MTGRWWLADNGWICHVGHMPVPDWYCLYQEIGRRAFLALMGST